MIRRKVEGRDGTALVTKVFTGGVSVRRTGEVEEFGGRVEPGRIRRKLGFSTKQNKTKRVDLVKPVTRQNDRGRIIRKSISSGKIGLPIVTL